MSEREDSYERAMQKKKKRNEEERTEKTWRRNN